MRSHFAYASCLAAIVHLAACGGQTSEAPSVPTTQPPDPQPPAATTPAPGPAPAAITFNPCPIYTGEQGGGAECATIEVPLDYAKPDGQKAELFVKRIPGTGSKRKQVWLLQGGPGGAGDGLEDMAAMLARQDSSLDVYIPDHRGTGRSTYLGCPKQQKVGLYDMADWQTCINEVKAKWGDGLATFSTTTAARDVGYAIERTRAPGQEAHVYGVSYGTYWAQRYMQVHPTQATSVVLDGVCQSGICSLTKYGYWYDGVAKKFMGECAADAFCAGKLGPDPVGKVKEALAKIDAHTCSGVAPGWRTDDMRQVFSMFIASVEMRNLVPAVTYRLLRCSPEDVSAINNMVAQLERWLGGGRSRGRRAWAPADDLSSDVLAMNIALSELEEDPPPSKDQLARLMEDAVFWHKDDTQMRDLYDLWPRYPHDGFVGKYPQTNVPVLLLNGTLDPQTPLEFAQEVAPHYTAASQRLVVLPRAAHGTVDQSPVVGRGRPCGWTLWTQTIVSPGGALDTSCLAKIQPHDFDKGAQLASTMFATPSLWGTSAGGGPRPPADPAFADALRRAVARAARAPRFPFAR
jgi:pimeloyl-ACP methyl ester carboxylesterase